MLGVADRQQGAPRKARAPRSPSSTSSATCTSRAARLAADPSNTGSFARCTDRSHTPPDVGPGRLPIDINHKGYVEDLAASLRTR